MIGKPKLARRTIKNFDTCIRSRSCEAPSAGGSAWIKPGKLKSPAKCHGIKKDGSGIMHQGQTYLLLQTDRYIVLLKTP